jgi:hypothetical protein
MSKANFGSRRTAKLSLGKSKLKFGTTLNTEAEEPTPVETFYILTEAGDTLTTEAGDELIIES